jgi:hypothetical protein
MLRWGRVFINTPASPRLLLPCFPHSCSPLALSLPISPFVVPTRNGSTKPVVPASSYNFARHTLNTAMDSMPIHIHSTSNPDLSKHVNIASAPTVEHREYLPRGVQETESEKQAHWFIGSIDCGTTSSRFLIFNGEGLPVASHQIEFPNIYPQSG